MNTNDASTMQNFPSGYPGFNQAIEIVSEAMGGELVRKAVADIFVEALYREINERTNPRWRPTGNEWTRASTDDFDRAVAWCMEYLQRQRPDATEEADWKDAKLRLRDEEVCIEAGGYAFPVARSFRTGDKWMITITDDGEKVLKEGGGFYLSSSPKTVHAGSAEAGLKSLRRIVAGFFKQELQPVEAVPDAKP